MEHKTKIYKMHKSFKHTICKILRETRTKQKRLSRKSRPFGPQIRESILSVATIKRCGDCERGLNPLLGFPVIA